MNKISRQGSESSRPLGKLARAFQESKILLTACQLGLFEPLADGSKTVKEVADTLKISGRGTDLMLRALVAMKLLKIRGENFSLTKVSRKYLLPSSPEYQGHLFRHMDHMFTEWASLGETVQRGLPAAPAGDDAELKDPLSARRDFVLAMAVNAAPSAGHLADRIDMKGVKTVIDIGGGPGAYAVAFINRHPFLRVTLFDRPEILEIARDYLKNRPEANRIDLYPGNILTSPPEGVWDMAWISHLIHSKPPEEVIAIFSSVRNILPNGGRILIHDFITNPDRTSPSRGAIFAVHMLAVSEGGRTYSYRELSEWLKKTGFAKIKLHRWRTNTAVVEGEKTNQ